MKKEFDKSLMQPIKIKNNENEILRTSELWINAVADADLNQLANLITEDIIVIHGNGRTISGKKEVIEDFAKVFEKFSIKQNMIHEETIISGNYAFDRAKVFSSLFDRATGEKKEYASETLTILRKESNCWRVARSLGVIIQETKD